MRDKRPKKEHLSSKVQGVKAQRRILYNDRYDKQPQPHAEVKHNNHVNSLFNSFFISNERLLKQKRIKA